MNINRQQQTNSIEVVESDLMYLVSYSTPVAAYVFKGIEGICLFKTNKKHSVTTSKHINKWIKLKTMILIGAGMSIAVKELSQEQLEQLIESGKMHFLNGYIAK